MTNLAFLTLSEFHLFTLRQRMHTLDPPIGYARVEFSLNVSFAIFYFGTFTFHNILSEHANVHHLGMKEGQKCGCTRGESRCPC